MCVASNKNRHNAPLGRLRPPINHKLYAMTGFSAAYLVPLFQVGSPDFNYGLIMGFALILVGRCAAGFTISDTADGMVAYA